MPLVVFAAQARTESEPQSITTLVWLAIFFVFLWGLLHGWLARGIHRTWAGTWILPGVMSDLPTLTRIYRWFGILLVLAAIGFGAAALIERHHHGTLAT